MKTESNGDPGKSRDMVGLSINSPSLPGHVSIHQQRIINEFVSVQKVMFLFLSRRRTEVVDASSKSFEGGGPDEDRKQR